MHIGLPVLEREGNCLMHERPPYLFTRLAESSVWVMKPQHVSLPLLNFNSLTVNVTRSLHKR